MMSRKQLLCLGLLLGIIVCAVAYDSEESYDKEDSHDKDKEESYDKDEYDGYKHKEHRHKHHKSHDKWGEYEEDDYPHHKHPKPSPAPPTPNPPPTPKCGPHMFVELKNNLCVDDHSGILQPGNCTTWDPKKFWCRPVPGFNSSCVYNLREKGFECRAKDGPCDLADTCTGESPICKDDIQNGTTCFDGHGPCKPAAKCNGYAKFCPKKPAKDGTPCSEEDGHAGLYSEVTDSTGKLMTADYEYAETEAKKHGYTRCHRCYDGHCVPFKYEWWWKGKKHDDDEHEHDHEDDDEPYKSDYYKNYYSHKAPADWDEDKDDWKKYDHKKKEYDSYDDDKDDDKKGYIASIEPQGNKHWGDFEPWFWCHWNEKEEH